MHSPVVVCVWDSKGHLFRSDTSFDDHGHASMQVGSRYLSFWPRDRGGKFANAAYVFILRNARLVNSYEEDCAKMGRPADHLIRLTSINNQKALAYWDVEMSLNGKFHLFESNCSTMVGKTLLNACDKDILRLIGLAVMSPQLLLAETFYWEPQKVLDVAEILQ